MSIKKKIKKKKFKLQGRYNYKEVCRALTLKRWLIIKSMEHILALPHMGKEKGNLVMILLTLGQG